MSPSGWRAVVALAFALVVGGITPAAADAPTERIREFFAGVNRVLADPSYDDRLPERLVAMRALVVDIVDFRNAASIALGFEWSMRSTSEREEFARLFADLLQTSVFSSVGGRARIDNGLTVSYIGELTDTDGVTVATSVLTRSGSEMAVGYRMSRRQGRWMVHDVVIDGVSIVENYRAQFQKVMQRTSYTGLVSEMRARIAGLGRPAPPGTVVTAAPSREEPVAAPEPAPIPAAPPAPVVVAAAPVEVAPSRSAPPIVAAPPPPVAAATPPRPAPPVAAAAPPRSASTVVASVSPRPIVPRVTRVTAYWVQVGAFQNVERAMHVATALRDHAVSLITAPGQPLMRVLIGPFSDRNAAAAKLREIRARGYDAFIADAPK